MTLRHSLRLRRLSVALAACAAMFLASACAGGGAPPSGSAPADASRSGGVEVFGVIDAGVTHTSTRGERR